MIITSDTPLSIAALMTTSNQAINLSNNSGGIIWDIPVTGTDAGTHSWRWHVDNNLFFRVYGIGDGAGSISGGAVEVNLPLTFASGLGSGITSNAYQVGNAGVALQYNVPTGSNYAFATAAVNFLTMFSDATTSTLSFAQFLAPTLSVLTRTSDAATSNITISGQNAFVQVGASTNSNGGHLILQGGNANTSDTATGNGGSIKMFPGKRGAFGDGAVEFYDNKTDLTQYGSIRRNNNDSSWFFDNLSSSGLVSIGYSSSGTYYSSFKVQSVATAVNFIQAQGSSTGNFPSVTAQGSDSNIELRLAGKGTKPVNIIKSATTGNTQLFTVTASSTTGSTGSSSISDIVFDLSPTRTWDTDAVSQQRDIVFQGRTHAASGAKPVSELYTLSLVAPTDSTNFNVSGTVAALETQATPVNRATGSAAGINIKLPTVANGIGNVGQMGGLFITANGGGAVSLGDTAGTVSAYAGIAIPQFTVEAGAAKTASLLAGIAAFAPVAGTNVTATGYAYYGSGRSLFTEPTTTFVANSSIVDIKRTGSLTATAGSFFSDVNISPTFTLTEPSSSSVIYAGLNIDMSGVSVTAGTGTSVITSLYLAANADPDAGSAYALYADGQGFFSGNFNTAGNLSVDGTTTLSGDVIVSKSINTTAGDSATINAIAGRFRKDTTGSTFTLTNSFITANSIIQLTYASDPGATGFDCFVVAGAGSATITFTTSGVAAAPASNTDINFLVIN